MSRSSKAAQDEKNMKKDHSAMTIDMVKGCEAESMTAGVGPNSLSLFSVFGFLLLSRNTHGVLVVNPYVPAHLQRHSRPLP